MNSIYELITVISKRSEEKTIIRYIESGQVKEISNKQFLMDIGYCCEYLKDYWNGETKGKHIVLLAPSSYEYIVVILSCGFLGSVIIPVNNTESKEVIDNIVRFSDADLVIDNPKNVIGRDKKSVLDMRKMQKDLEDELSYLLFTSGTSGKSKGVMLSQKNILTSAGIIDTYFDDISNMRPDIKFSNCYIMLPLYHSFGLALLYAALIGEVVVDVCSDLRMFYRDLSLYNSEIIACPPIAVNLMMTDILRGKLESWGKSLKFVISGSAPLSPKVIDVLKANGLFVALGYGMTETAGAGTLNISCDNPLSVGKSSEKTDIEIRDGEIFLKNDSVMLGYYKDEEETRNVLNEGWIATGDLGSLDDNGYLYITGRKKNLIILSSGENISPEEIEQKLLTNKDILEVVVKEDEQKICAEIFCDPSKEKEIIEQVKIYNSSVPMYKRITKYVFRNEPFEKTSSGKILRK